jgi:hypothetical protein
MEKPAQPSSGGAGLMSAYTSNQPGMGSLPDSPPTAPDISGWKYGAMLGAFGPQAAQAWHTKQLAPYRANMSGFIIRNLMEGRPKTMPISGAEWTGLLYSIDPRLMADERMVKGVRFVVDQWNKTALHLSDAAMRQAANLYESGKNLGAYYTPDQRSQMARHGYLVRDPGAALASNPGLFSQAGPGPNGGAAQSKPKFTVKNTAFPGLYPNPGMLSAEKIRYETPARVDQTRATSAVEQDAQTRGAMQRHFFEQQNPSGQYVTHTDPATGRQTRLWSGGRKEVDLGMPIKSGAGQLPKFSDYSTARNSVGRFFMPPGPLGEVKRLDKTAQQEYFAALRRFQEFEAQGISPGEAFLGALDPSYMPQRTAGTPSIGTQAPSQTPVTGAATKVRDLKIAARIGLLLSQGMSVAVIREKLTELGIDPDIYSELTQ